MNKKSFIALQWVVLTALVVVGSIFTIILFGEDNGSMPLFDFFIMKAGALFAICGEYHASIWCANNNLIPAPVMRYFNRCIKDEED